FIATAVLAVVLLYAFGRTTQTTNESAQETHLEGDGHDHSAEENKATTLDFNTLLAAAKEKLNADQAKRVMELENSVVRGNVQQQQIHAYHLLAQFWKDSIGTFIPYAKYTAEAAKLENSEKSLTFAAHLLLAALPDVEEAPLQTWMAKEARTLFEKAYELNPKNDSTAVGLGSCYFFGAVNAGEMPMKGITLIREVTERNPNNAFAHYMLGLGSFISAQWPKAVERFTKVVALEPDNMEAILRLADAAERNGDKAAAKKWFIRFTETVQRLEKQGKFRSNPDMMKRIDNHIKTL
ncbi:MAG: tetratricopeptide repeat protein, partial [Chitinophagaceae bacterium]